MSSTINHIDRKVNFLFLELSQPLSIVSIHIAFCVSTFNNLVSMIKDSSVFGLDRFDHMFLNKSDRIVKVTPSICIE